MSKTAISIRLGDPELQAIDHLTNDGALNRSRVIEAILQSFLAQDFFAQRAALRDALGIKKTPLGARRPERWGT